MDLDKNIAHRIRIIMAEKDLKSKDIVEKSGWSQTYVSMVRTGKYSALKRLDQWAAALDCQVPDLLK